MEFAQTEAGMLLLGLLFVFLGLGIWIGLALALVGLVGVVVLPILIPAMPSMPPEKVMGTAIWQSLASWTLAALPLFIWMGEILFRTRLSEDMFRGLAPWVQRLPGRLMHVNVIGCGIFAAVSGSSAATAATIGKMSLPALTQRGYHVPMAVGSLAGAGTLGLLIPPSIVMIVYGVAAEVSIVRLFIAGVIPGIMLMVLFSGYIAVWSLMNPTLTPPADPPMPFMKKVRESGQLIPVVLLIAFVMGSIYLGWATATEAAVFGVVGALALSAWGGSLSWKSFADSLMGAVRLSCMINLILAGAAFLTQAMAYSGIPAAMAAWVGAQGFSPFMIIACLTVIYLILGCFIDGISMIVLTVSVVLPIIASTGFDLVWFGIFIVLVVELAQITPPVGFNLFVLQGLTGKGIFEVAKNTLPFFFLMLVAVAIVTVFPGVVTWLPQTMLAR
ncbi:TRAP transporter large permease subunit [Roseomonas sp. PWR1]|uniref:TRAP transporter large permease protein n=1 Tax=Roseomonas nitratireducens TaxID=2820810 RepID=A0ABS4AU46_9PROT|nr:TRAP transporter large permease subunit [Neoroseomonas nitratireducens]MBP0464883.1 TRAP transporter large permease subunit [Neoroseomonas nitratireducens]